MPPALLLAEDKVQETAMLSPEWEEEIKGESNDDADPQNLHSPGGKCNRSPYNMHSLLRECKFLSLEFTPKEYKFLVTKNNSSLQALIANPLNQNFPSKGRK
jgi:hypothetical protein